MYELDYANGQWQVFRVCPGLTQTGRVWLADFPSREFAELFITIRQTRR